MKKLFLKSLPIVFIACSIFSCSPEPEEMITPLEVNSVTINKEHLLTDETAMLEIEATGFDKIQVTSNSDEIEITKISDTRYEVSAKTTASGNVSVSIISNSDSNNNQLESFSINFYKTGTSDFHTVDGLVVDVDSIEKALLIHGEPDVKYEYTSELSNGSIQDYVRWSYLSKGFELIINNDNNIISAIRIWNSWSREVNGRRIEGVPYSHNIGNLNFTTNNNTMDKVLEELGEPSSRESHSSPDFDLKWFNYADLNPNIDFTQGATFYFFSNSISNFTGKEIFYIYIY